MSSTPETDWADEGHKVALKCQWDQEHDAGVIAAALRTAYQRGVTDEREACARVADAQAMPEGEIDGTWDTAWSGCARAIGARIRSRTQDTPT